MRIATLFVALALAVASLSVPASRAAEPSPPAATAAAGRVVYEAFASESLGRRVRYAISLPASYDREPSRRYPLVVFLHGLFNSEEDWERRGMQKELERLRAEGKIGDFIVAIPFGENSFYLNAKNGARYEDAIVRDFVPYLDASYRTTAKPSERVLGGISMGGYGAFVIAFKHPQMFAGVVAISAAVFGDLPQPPGAGADRRSAGRYQLAKQIFGDPPDREFFRANNPLDLASANAAKLKSLAIYFDVGEQDRYGFAGGNVRLHETLDKAGVTHSFFIGPGDHGWSFLATRSEPALTFIWRVLDQR